MRQNRQVRRAPPLRSARRQHGSCVAPQFRIAATKSTSSSTSGLRPWRSLRRLERRLHRRRVHAAAPCAHCIEQRLHVSAQQGLEATPHTCCRTLTCSDSNISAALARCSDALHRHAAKAFEHGTVRSGASGNARYLNDDPSRSSNLRPDGKFFHAPDALSLRDAVARSAARRRRVASSSRCRGADQDGRRMARGQRCSLVHDLDQYAVGTSRAMAHYLDVWQALPSLWARGVRDELGHPLVDEKLLYAHVLRACFGWTTFESRSWTLPPCSTSGCSGELVHATASRGHRFGRIN